LAGLVQRPIVRGRAVCICCQLKAASFAHLSYEKTEGVAKLEAAKHLPKVLLMGVYARRVPGTRGVELLPSLN
jgi:hypothetical protein